MLYKDLNLKKIRDEVGLDFAHYTYQKGQCSCCYGPLDMPARYWKGGKKPEKVYNPENNGRTYHYELDGVVVTEPTYILFTNASNGQGTVKSTDEIRPLQHIEHHLKDDQQLYLVCKMLYEQLKDTHRVQVPLSHSYSIRLAAPSVDLNYVGAYNDAFVDFADDFTIEALIELKEDFEKKLEAKRKAKENA